MDEELIEIKYAKKTNEKWKHYKKYVDAGWKAEKIVTKLQEQENVSTIEITIFTEIKKSIFYKIGGKN